jgi:hypothetical protein
MILVVYQYRQCACSKEAATSLHPLHSGGTFHLAAPYYTLPHLAPGTWLHLTSRPSVIVFHGVSSCANRVQMNLEGGIWQPTISGVGPCDE